MIRRQVERRLEAAGRIGGRAGLEKDQPEVHPQAGIGRILLEERPVDPLRLDQLTQLEERKPQQVARALVVGFGPQRLFEELARRLRVSALQRLRAGGEGAVELPTRGFFVVEPSRLFRPPRAGFHQREPPTEAGIAFAPVRFSSA